MTATPFAYDSVNYPTYALPQGHPDRLATIATLFGMQPAPFDRCRVLEIACSDGGNLLPMAYAKPDSTFVGVDLAGKAIAQGQRDIAALGLTNIQLHYADLMEFTPGGEPFDYIIAHGFYSWVPVAVRDRLLALCGERLAPHGVAYVSYNALPGGHVRRMLREMLLFHAGGFSDPDQKMRQARAFLQLLVAAQRKPDEFTALLKKEAEWILHRDGDALLFHDDLADINDPVYFHQFAAHAGGHGLQYLGEASFHEMQDMGFPPDVAFVLGKFHDNIILKEQYLDFLRCRRFRQTLLCRAGVSLKRDLRAEQMTRFYVASSAEPASAAPSLDPGVIERFTGPRKSAMQIDHPLTKAAMIELRSIWPKAIRFVDLVRAARRRLGQSPAASDDSDAQTLADVVLGGYSAGLLELRLLPSCWAQPAGERPKLWPLARYQLDVGKKEVAGLNHTSFRVADPIVRAMLLLLDGTRDRAAIVNELGRRVDAGELALPESSPRDQLAADVERSLETAAAEGLLIE